MSLVGFPLGRGLASLFSPADVVAIFDQNNNQLFTNARTISAYVSPSAKVMEHPAETGVEITDNIIINQVEIELVMVLVGSAISNTFQQIANTFNNATLVTVQTRAQVYTNQLIQKMPFEQSPDMFDAITVTLQLKQTLFVTPAYSVVPRSATKTSTVNRGTQQTNTPTPASSSAAYNIFKGS